jgi:hypothetical protein
VDVAIEIRYDMRRDIEANTLLRDCKRTCKLYNTIDIVRDGRKSIGRSFSARALHAHFYRCLYLFSSSPEKGMFSLLGIRRMYLSFRKYMWSVKGIRYCIVVRYKTIKGNMACPAVVTLLVLRVSIIAVELH